jgi:hypothetical protein
MGQLREGGGKGGAVTGFERHNGKSERQARWPEREAGVAAAEAMQAVAERKIKWNGEKEARAGRNDIWLSVTYVWRIMLNMRHTYLTLSKIQ